MPVPRLSASLVALMVLLFLAVVSAQTPANQGKKRGFSVVEASIADMQAAMKDRPRHVP